MELVNSFAVVTYLQGALAKFVEVLREALRPGDVTRTHITVLPPRPLQVSVSEALEYLAGIAADIEPFDVRPGEVEAFENTHVIKLSIAEGREGLQELNHAFNSGPFHATDPYDYNPHITLILKVELERFQECLDLARRIWMEFGPVQPVRVETLTLVQQDRAEKWRDQGHVKLGARRPLAG